MPFPRHSAKTGWLIVDRPYYRKSYGPYSDVFQDLTTDHEPNGACRKPKKANSRLKYFAVFRAALFPISWCSVLALLWFAFVVLRNFVLVHCRLGGYVPRNIRATASCFWSRSFFCGCVALGCIGCVGYCVFRSSAIRGVGVSVFLLD